MAENPKQTKELTTTQEGIIAGLVLLFFGLLYWYLNPWQSEKKATMASTEQQLAGQPTSMANSAVASGTPLVPSEQEASTTTETTTTAPQTAATPVTVATSTTSNPAAPVTVATTTTETVPVNAAMSGTSTEPSPTTTTETAPSSSATAPAASTTPEVAVTTTSTTTTEKPAEVSSTTPAATAPAIGTAANPSTAKASEPEAKPTASAAASPDTTATTTQTAATSSSTTNKLELAPGSPESKLQTYLAKGILETPVVMDGIEFEPKTPNLTKDSEAKVLLLAALLAQYPEANFLITARTTETSTDNKSSEELSLMREKALGLQLVKAGVNGKRITILGVGKLAIPDKTSAASKKNQRVEISVIK